MGAEEKVRRVEVVDLNYDWATGRYAAAGESSWHGALMEPQKDLMLSQDTRIGGRIRYYLASEREVIMQVPDEVRKCVVFVAYRDPKGIRLVGTAFFVAVGVDDPSPTTFPYLVTAKHVIDGIRAKSTDSKVLLRMNLRDGSAQIVESEIDQWLGHPTDTSADVSVLAWGPPIDVYDYRVFPVAGVATEEVITKQAIGVGDDVFLTGLFVNHHGNKRNIPIVRVGNIAAMPEEPVQTQFGPMDAYLIEARSIGGISGSPVFAHLGFIRRLEGQIRHSAGGDFFLLGLVHGHWDVNQSDPDGMVQDDLNKERINMGIAIVVPGTKIIDTINRTEFVEMREKVVEDKRKNELPAMDDDVKTS